MLQPDEKCNRQGAYTNLNVLLEDSPTNRRLETATSMYFLFLMHGERGAPQLESVPENQGTKRREEFSIANTSLCSFRGLRKASPAALLSVLLLLLLHSLRLQRNPRSLLFAEVSYSGESPEQVRWHIANQVG